MSDALKRFREQIDEIDDTLLTLFNRRAALAGQIGHAKGSSVVLRPEREAQILRRLLENNAGPLGDEAISTLFTELISHCRALEAPLVVAYLGPEGTFSEQAARKRFGSVVTGLPCLSIDEAFHAVESGSAHYAVVPVENSTEGAVGRTLDLLLNSALLICGEVLLQVHQCLLSNEQDLGLVRKVYSHPQSFGQCMGWLNTHLPHAERVTASSNADAARLAASESFAAAIAGAQAGEHYKLKTLAQNIEDDARNTTRFLVLGKQSVAPSGRDKTSLVLSAQNRPGAVHALLEPLARHGVSMTRLESRPARSGLWEYVFYIDLEGHQQEAALSAALADLKQAASLFKVLGSYPVA